MSRLAYAEMTNRMNALAAVLPCHTLTERLAADKATEKLLASNGWTYDAWFAQMLINLDMPARSAVVIHVFKKS